MARKKENKPMTRQVRMYEDDAKIIDLVMFLMSTDEKKKKTFADIVRPALREYYKDAAKQVDEIHGNTVDVVSEPKKRNRS